MPPEPQSHKTAMPCPCGTGKSLKDCCLPFIEGSNQAVTAEQLMRSRYSAYTLLAIDYLWETWSPEQRLRTSKADILAWAKSCEWLSLQILATREGGANQISGTVEFIALYRQQGQLHQHHEVSQFKRVLNKWLYLDHQA